jgi:predicted AAA+ superfamily ATPase
LNFTSIGGDAQVPPRTVREYYQLLDDTLVGHMLPPFQKARQRKAVATSKFYFFDVGVANVLRRVYDVPRGSNEYGRALEHQVMLELRAYLDYERRDDDLRFWRSHSQLEVDFVIGDHTAVEVKAGTVSDRDLKGLRALHEDIRMKRYVVSGERAPRRTADGIEIVPVDLALQRLWEGTLLAT